MTLSIAISAASIVVSLVNIVVLYRTWRRVQRLEGETSSLGRVLRVAASRSVK